MKNELHNELLHSLFMLKKFTHTFRPAVPPKEDEMSLVSFTLLYYIKEHKGDLSGEKIRNALSVTKPAVSQMLAVLEKKGFLTREINKENRRCIVLSLTEKGTRFIEKTEKETEKRLAGIISRFGKNETRSLITLINRFLAITEER
ncbi:MarR family winged helix-turn-helix transcriptional regulator [Leadbettera azotonutricia]|uniref:Transcriptional regulator, MarR family n=1 Tax=Leadbettera azotonutricia (strain ATCC BAA-888 / DSM 13862 / ZAS-9) TaxID=545695 RepID=F5YEI4_LEAAZ|nr:MarR family transcriptional regulator [Leadbettera azotonutricia]AEF82485.1 transcriptional regulator, MarR family [Leadbettera azotonutricia ZAS-9]